MNCARRSTPTSANAWSARAASRVLRCKTRRLVSKGYTNAEKALAANYAPGDVVAFHRSYMRLGVEKGEERRVLGVDREGGTVRLEGPDGSIVDWKPARIGGRRGGTEVYRTETIELRAGDRVRWTRNDKGLGLVNSATAEVSGVRNGRVTFMLEEGRKLVTDPRRPATAPLSIAPGPRPCMPFRGVRWTTSSPRWRRTIPHLTTAKAFYVEISRARDRAELVT